MRKHFDEYFPIVFLYGMGAYFLLDTEDFTPDALLYPKWLAYILFVLTTLLFAVTLLKKISLPKQKDEKIASKFGIIFIFSLLYVSVLPFLGFVISSLFYCPATAMTLGYKRKGMAICVSVAAVALLYAGFRLVLKVPIPTATILGLSVI